MKKIVFFSIGALTLILTVTLYFVQMSESAANSTATGTVIDLENVAGTFYPVVRFATLQGDTTVFTSSVGTTPPAYDVDQLVEVSYDPNDPNSAYIVSFISQWLIITLLGTTSLVFIALGLFIGKRAPVVLQRIEVKAADSLSKQASPNKVMTILFGIGALLLAVSGSIWYINNSATANWVHAEGRVIGYTNDTRHNRPIIEYTLNDGTVRKFTSSMSVSGMPYDIGESIDVYYDPVNTFDAKTDTFFDRWFVVLIVGAIGVITIFIGVVFKLVGT